MTEKQFDLFMDEQITELYVSSGLLSDHLQRLLCEKVIDFRTSIREILRLLSLSSSANYSEDQVSSEMKTMELHSGEQNLEDLCYSM